MQAVLILEQMWILAGSILWENHRYLKKYNDLGWKFREPKDPIIRKASRYIGFIFYDGEDQDELLHMCMETFEDGKAEYQIVRG